MEDTTASQQISNIIEQYGGWKGELIAQLRSVIISADPSVVEEVKWKMPTRPEGLPVWSYNGILCMTETFKNDVKLVFVKGAFIKDPTGLFNARLNSKTNRAIEYHEDFKIDKTALTNFVKQAVALNTSK